MTAIRLAGSPAEVAAAYAVRADVFVTEQGVLPELELDELDVSADHFVAYDGELPVGAGRLVVEDPGFEGADPALGEVGHLGRLAVRPQAGAPGWASRWSRPSRLGPPSAGCGSWRCRPRPRRWGSTSGSATRRTGRSSTTPACRTGG